MAADDYTTGELEARPSPRELEAELARTNRRAMTFAGLALILLLVIAGVTLAYVIRTLDALQAATGPAAQNRQAELIAQLVADVTCERRDDLEAAVEALLADGSSEPPQVSIRFPDPACPQ